MKVRSRHRRLHGGLSSAPKAAAAGSAAEKLQRAAALHRQGQLDTADALYRDILQANPRDPDALQLLGVIAGQRGQAQQAIELIEQSLAINPANAAAWSNHGNALLALTRYGDALESYDRALAIKPKHADALHSRGVSLHHLGRTRDALASYDRSLAIRPDYPPALNHRGIALCKLARHSEALISFRRAVALQPGVAEFQLNLGKALLQLRQQGAAELSLRQALKIEKSAEAFESLATALYQMGRCDEVMETHRQWLDFEPDNPIPQHIVTAGSDGAPARASDRYLANTFDNFAENFETTLLGLGYCAPELLIAGIRAARGTDGAPLRILDAGCGTGLAAPLLKPLASRLVGVDLSEKMLDKARERQLYDELVRGELCAFMASQPAAFDLIILADTLIYFGSLEEAFRTAHQALAPGGILAFAVESHADSSRDYRLELHGRYSHHPDYVRRLLTARGYTVQALEPAVLRRELNTDVTGLVVLARPGD